jgi:choline-phosphate cytidylyltransferase/glycerol-3-phosphate cytidylyltransferase
MKVLTLGSFDMLHPGHLGLFDWCRRLAGDSGVVVVSVNTDEFVTRFKTQPRFHTSERVAMVRALRGVDFVLENDGGSQGDLIAKINPNLLVIGSDWARKDYLAQLDIAQDWLDEHHIALAYVPRTGDWSSTELRARGTRLPSTDDRTEGASGPLHPRYQP